VALRPILSDALPFSDDNIVIHIIRICQAFFPMVIKLITEKKNAEAIDSLFSGGGSPITLSSARNASRRYPLLIPCYALPSGLLIVAALVERHLSQPSYLTWNSEPPFTIQVAGERIPINIGDDRGHVTEIPIMGIIHGTDSSRSVASNSLEVRPFIAPPPAPPMGSIRFTSYRRSSARMERTGLLNHVH
jgi:hypothetical protein